MAKAPALFFTHPPTKRRFLMTLGSRGVEVRLDGDDNCRHCWQTAYSLTEELRGETDLLIASRILIECGEVYRHEFRAGWVGE
jgi:hypothetical protein